MKISLNRLERLRVRSSRAVFLWTVVLRDRFFSPRPLKILFSAEPESWRKPIGKSFALSKHQIAFAPFTTDKLGQYDLVVPLNVADLEYLDQNRDRIPCNPIPIPGLASVKLCDDKYLFNQAMIEKGFGRFIPAISGVMSYPYILKKKTDAWGKNCFIIHGPEQEKLHAAQLGSDDFFTQEIITGNEEFATHVLYKGGKIMSSLNIQYVFDSALPIKGQDARFYRRIVPCPYLGEFAEILRAIEFEGLCCFNYKVRAGQAMILEINPRFGGSLCAYFILFVARLN